MGVRTDDEPETPRVRSQGPPALVAPGVAVVDLDQAGRADAGQVGLQGIGVGDDGGASRSGQAFRAAVVFGPVAAVVEVVVNGQGQAVRFGQFVRIGLPFTLASVASSTLFGWLIFR